MSNEIIRISNIASRNKQTQKNKYSYEEFYNKIQKQIIRPKLYVDIVKMSYEM